MTPSSLGMIIAAFTSSLHPSNFDKSIGLRLVLNLSLLTPGAGFISAAILQRCGNNPLFTIIRYCHLTVVGLRWYCSGFFFLTLLFQRARNNDNEPMRSRHSVSDIHNSHHIQLQLFGTFQDSGAASELSYFRRWHRSLIQFWCIYGRDPTPISVLFFANAIDGESVIQMLRSGTVNGKNRGL